MSEVDSQPRPLTEDQKILDVAIDEMRDACQRAADHYFGLRPQLLRTPAQESIFRAGFEHAWHELWKRPISQEDRSWIADVERTARSVKRQNQCGANRAVELDADEVLKLTAGYTP